VPFDVAPSRGLNRPAAQRVPETAGTWDGRRSCYVARACAAHLVAGSSKLPAWASNPCWGVFTLTLHLVQGARRGCQWSPPRTTEAGFVFRRFPKVLEPFEYRVSMGCHSGRPGSHGSSRSSIARRRDA
jgi:hypothetical protein